jgi:hypothetical protein
LNLKSHNPESKKNVIKSIGRNCEVQDRMIK